MAPPAMLASAGIDCPFVKRCPLLLQKGYAWWETAAVMGTQTALVVFNCWFLVASWRRVR